MTCLKILKYPDNRLRRIARPVKIIDKQIKKIIYDMFETMYKKNGIGLAAPQVNINLKIIVIDIMDKYFKPIVLINPKKIYENDIIQIQEGCLSIPGIKKKITRSKNIKIKALNCYGKKIIIKAKSLLSVCIQHEMDHLIGKLLTDY